MARVRACIVALMSFGIACGAYAELSFSEKNFKLPIRRVNLKNPAFLDSPCVPRYFAVSHRRSPNGRAYGIVVTPLDIAEDEFVPDVKKTFARWRFGVPKFPEWRDRYLKEVHDNLFFTIPAEGCGTLKENLPSVLREHSESLNQTLNPADVAPTTDSTSEPGTAAD